MPKVLFLLCICVIASKHANHFCFLGPTTVLLNIWIPGSLRDHLSQPPTHGLNLPQNNQDLWPFRLCAHTPMPGNLLGSIPSMISSACEKCFLILNPNLSFSATKNQIPNLGLNRGLQIFQGLRGWSCVPFVLYPKLKQPQFLPPRPHTRRSYDLYRAE